MTIWNIPELRARTEAASKLPPRDLPEVGTVVYGLGNDLLSVCLTQGPFTTTAHGWTAHGGKAPWRYATPQEIDQFEHDSALPDIVDPIDAEIKAITDNWRVDGWSVAQIARVAILRGIEIGRARKAGA